MVEDIDANQLAGLHDLPGDMHIFGGRARIAARMVVTDDDGGRVEADRLAEELPTGRRRC